MQIVAFLRDARLDGEDCPGLRLPFSRVPAADLGVLVFGVAATSPDRMADTTRLLRRLVLRHGVGASGSPCTNRVPVPCSSSMNA